MSDGGIGKGLTYWATINITGDLDKDQLKAVLDEVRRVLGSKVTAGPSPEVNAEEGQPIQGVVKQAARLANTAEPQISVTLGPAKNKT
jgi:hypothetical protein